MQKTQLELRPTATSPPSTFDAEDFGRSKLKWRPQTLFTLALLFITCLLFVLLCLAHVRLRNIQFEWSSETFRNGDLIPRWLRRFDQSSGHRQSVCLSPACIESAAFLLQRIDFQVDPCDNFYDFACGKFLQTHTVPDDHLSRNILQEIQDEIYIEMKGFLEGNDSLPMEGASIAQNKTKVVHDKLNDEENHDQQSDHDRKKRRVTSSLSNNAIRKARLFYRSCMNESTVNNEPAAIHVLLRLLTDEFQVRWPLLDQLVFQNDTIDDLSIDLERRMFLVFLHQIQPLLHFYVAPEELKSQSKEYALHLYSGTTVLEFGYLLNDSLANQSQSETNSSSSDHRLAYAQLQVDILHRLSEHLGQPQFNHTQALQHVSEVIDFEIDLARITKNFTDTSTILGDESSPSDSTSELSLDELSINLTSMANGVSTASSASSAQLNSQSTTARKVHYERVKPIDLQRSHSFLNWSRLLNRMERISGARIKQILVESNDHLIQVGHLIERHSRRSVENYLCWATIARFLPYLGSHFRRLYADFRRKVPDLTQNADAPLEFASFRQTKSTFIRSTVSGFGLRPRNDWIGWPMRRSGGGGSSGRLFLSRWKECVHLTTEGLKSASAVLYVQQRQSLVESVSQHVARLVDRLQSAFEQIVDSQSWLTNSDRVRVEIKRRARSIRSRIALPVGLLHSADQALADLQIEVHAVFVANIVAMLRHEMTNELKRLTQTPDSERDWLMEPLVPNAYYDSLNHFIILPLAILRKPLVNSKRPTYLDYATLGVVIGHEIAHAFDSGTRREVLQAQHLHSNQSTSTTNELSWWPRHINTEYERRARCFAAQFNNYLITEIQEYINGNLTLEENICDFAGLQQAYLAYKTSQWYERDHVLLPGLANFTTDQLFFVQYAQVWCEISSREGYQKSLIDSHAPGRFRANGVVSNSPQYAKAFHCRAGQPMHPVDKCAIWSSDQVRPPS